MTYLRSGIFLAPFHDLRQNPILALERDFELLQPAFLTESGALRRRF